MIGKGNVFDFLVDERYAGICSGGKSFPETIFKSEG